MEISKLIDFLHIMEKMKCQTRHSFTGTGRPESVAEHSWRLALMAYLIKGEFPAADIDRVILMCLFHDIGEAVTGDIPSFNKKEADEEAESKAVAQLLATLPEPYQSELGELFREMHRMETPEAKIYKALDKMEAVLQHNEADLATWLPLEYELNQVYGVEQAEFSPYLRELRQRLTEETQRKITAAQSAAVTCQAASKSSATGAP